MRFVELTSEVSVQYWAEFLGENASWYEDYAKTTPEAHFFWPKENIHYEPKRVVSDPRAPGGKKVLDETLRVYLTGTKFERVYMVSLSYDLENLRENIFAASGGRIKQENFLKLQFRRKNDAKIVCFRPSDEVPALTGFGRLKPGAIKHCHQDFSETYVDRAPGREFDKYENGVKIGVEAWNGFEPVWLKALSASGEMYSLEVRTEWASDISIHAHKNPEEGLPEMLAAYEFSGRTRSVSREADEFESGAVKRQRK